MCCMVGGSPPERGSASCQMKENPQVQFQRLLAASQTYQGLHMNRGKVRVGALRASRFSAPSVELWLCSLSVSSRSEHKSSLDMVERAGDRAEVSPPDGLPTPWEAGAMLLLTEESVMSSISTSWRWSSFRGMLSSRWLRSSAATAASMPGQLDTNMWTSCMHWM